MNKLLVSVNDLSLQVLIRIALATEGYDLRCPSNAESTLAILAEEPFDLIITELDGPAITNPELLQSLSSKSPELKLVILTEAVRRDAPVALLRGQVCTFLARPFTVDELRNAVTAVLGTSPTPEIEVISAAPEWIELRVPCGLSAVQPLQALLAEIGRDLSEPVRQAIGDVFHEMLANAIEHGCKLDATKRVEISYVRLKHAIICRIKDPGEGFDPDHLEHAAVSSPPEDPFRHMQVREKQSRRAGGFGLLLAKRLVDEIVYNERHNEVIFVKYLP